MAQTLTIQEFEALRQGANHIGYKAAGKRCKLRKLGRKLDNDGLKDLWLLTRALDTFEQGKFTSEEYTNFINSAQVRNIFANVKKLAHGLQ